MRSAAAAALVFATALLAAGCGGSHQAAPKTTSSTTACVLSAAQRRDIAAARREIVRMHRLEAPMHKWKERGPTSLELATNRFLLDVGPLPVAEKEHLMNLGKSAVGLCGDCFTAIESGEPAAQTRYGRSPCAA